MSARWQFRLAISSVYVLACYMAWRFSVNASSA
jgi:hypothetical protein